MAEHDRSLLDQFLLAGLGVASLTRGRLEEVAGALATRSGMGRDDVRQLLEDALARWRGDAVRVGERAGENLQDLYTRLGLVTREEYEELELRLAQIEHRLRLLEGP